MKQYEFWFIVGSQTLYGEIPCTREMTPEEIAGE